MEPHSGMPLRWQLQLLRPRLMRLRECLHQEQQKLLLPKGLPQLAAFQALPPPGEMKKNETKCSMTELRQGTGAATLQKGAHLSRHFLLLLMATKKKKRWCCLEQGRPTDLTPYLNPLNQPCLPRLHHCEAVSFSGACCVDEHEQLQPPPAVGFGPPATINLPMRLPLHKTQLRSLHQHY